MVIDTDYNPLSPNIQHKPYILSNVRKEMEIDNTTDSVGPIQNNIGEHQYEVDTSPSQNPCQNMQAPQTLYT